MKAVEFIRKFGWDSAISVVFNRNLSATSYRVGINSISVLGGIYGQARVSTDSNTVLIAELKKYTDAYGLVQHYGGLKGVGDYLKNLRLDSYDELKQAISLVEEVGECNE